MPVSQETLSILANADVAPVMYKLINIADIILLTNSPINIKYKDRVYLSSIITTVDSTQSTEGSKIANLQISGVTSGELNYLQLESVRDSIVRVYLWIENPDRYLGGESSSAPFVDLIFRGKVGISKIEGGSKFSIEILSDIVASDRSSLRQVATTCWLTLGSQRCGVILDNFALDFSITTVYNTDRFLISYPGPIHPTPNFFAYGKLIIRDAASINQRLITSYFDGYEVRLLNPVAFPVKPGMTGTMYFGCDKLIGTCKRTFNNSINFLGFPKLPNLNERLAGI